MCAEMLGGRSSEGRESWEEDGVLVCRVRGVRSEVGQDIDCGPVRGKIADGITEEDRPHKTGSSTRGYGLPTQQSKNGAAKFVVTAISQTEVIDWNRIAEEALPKSAPI